MKITLTNDFHGTSVNVIPGPGGWLSSRQVRRVSRELCGSRDCYCGQVTGGAYGLVTHTDGFGREVGQIFDRAAGWE